MEGRDEVQRYRELDRLIDAADVNIPVVDLTAGIMSRIKTGEGKAGVSKFDPGRRKRVLSLIQDLVTAAAAAIIIFWVSGPVLAGGNTPSYTKEVVNVSATVGGVFQSYLDFSVSTLDSLSQSLEQIAPSQRKGAE